MMAIGYKQSQGDHTLFVKHSPSGGVKAILVYVDDIIVTGDNDKERQFLSQCLGKGFEKKALGRLNIFLELRWLTLSSAFLISQQKYVMISSKKQARQHVNQQVLPPIDPNLRLGKAEEDASVDRNVSTYGRKAYLFVSHTIGYSICNDYD